MLQKLICLVNGTQSSLIDNINIRNTSAVTLIRPQCWWCWPWLRKSNPLVSWVVSMMRRYLDSELCWERWQHMILICWTSHWDMGPKFKCNIPVSQHQLCYTNMLHHSQPICKLRHRRHNDPKPQPFSQHLGNKNSDILVFSISTANIISSKRGSRPRRHTYVRWVLLQ